MVVELKFGFDIGRMRTFGEVAAVLKVSRQRVKQLLDRALRHLRIEIGGQGLHRVLSGRV